MPTQVPHRFHVTMKDPNSEQRRFTTLTRVPCPKCASDPTGNSRGGFMVGEHMIPTCHVCDGRGDVPATAESAVAFLEEQEAERVAFRLDDPAVLGKYSLTMPVNALEIVEQTVLHVPKDTHTVNGFFRAGKVIRAAGGDPSVAYESAHKGWLAFHLQEEPFKVERVGRMNEQMVIGGQYGIPKRDLYSGAATWDWDTDTIKVALTTSAYTVDIDTHDKFNDVTNELSTAGNYTAGGWTLTASAPTYDTTTDQIRLDGTDITQASATFTARKAVVYKSTGTSSTSPLISYLDFQSDVSPSAGTFTITWDTTGIYIDDIT